MNSNKLYPSLGIYLSCLNPRYLAPDLELNSFLDVDVKKLKQSGIRGVILDVDNTLMPYNGMNININVGRKLDEIKSEFNTCILSNTNSQRMRELEKMLGVHVVSTEFRKPLPQPFLDALEYLETIPLQTAIIGDRLLTDIAGAKKIGIYAIKVSPVDIFSEPLNHSIVRFFETFVLGFYRE